MSKAFPDQVYDNAFKEVCSEKKADPKSDWTKNKRTKIHDQLPNEENKDELYKDYQKLKAKIIELWDYVYGLFLLLLFFFFFRVRYFKSK